MKTKIKLVLLTLFCAALCGCETYSKQKWTPDSFNYTLQRDRTTGDQSDYWGMSWNLKP